MPARRQPTSHSTASGPRCAARCMALLLLSGLAITSLMPAITMAQDRDGVSPRSRDTHADHIAEASHRFGIPASWIAAVMHAESAGEVRAVSSAGAVGLMQLMPGTWAEHRARHDLGRDPYDPRDNILAGTAYLREMWDRYGDIAAMLAAYNAGPARYDEYRSKGRPLPAETRAYVASLAPALRGERPWKNGSSIVRPFDWREAAIFVGRDDGASSVRPASADRSSDDALSSVTATPQMIVAAQPEELFVIRDAAGDQP